MQSTQSANVNSRRGTSLMDVIAATIVTALVILPAARIMRESMSLNRRLQTRQEMVSRCSSLLEQQLAQQADSFRAKKSGGTIDYESERLGYQIICSDRPDFGGQSKRMMGIDVMVWHDLNRNRRKDSLEPQVSLYSITVSPTVLKSVSAKFSPAPSPKVAAKEAGPSS